jgi:NAD-dependent deacetylase
MAQRTSSFSCASYHFSPMPTRRSPLADLTAVAQRLRQARHVAVLTGAGVSADSGVPTFRDAMTGLWATYRAEDLATPEAFARDPRFVWDWYRWRRTLIDRAHPNEGHRALADLERRVQTFVLVTQNVDGLHTLAGSRNVVELHGNIRRARCTACARTFDWAASDAMPVRCAACGSMARPDVVWFGEHLPADALDAAYHAARTCDLLFSVGTSNLVFPAASIPPLAATQGADVVIVNPDMAGQPVGATVTHLTGRSAEVLPELVREAWGDAGDEA